MSGQFETNVCDFQWALDNSGEQIMLHFICRFKLNFLLSGYRLSSEVAFVKLHDCFYSIGKPDTGFHERPTRTKKKN